MKSVIFGMAACLFFGAYAAHAGGLMHYDCTELNGTSRLQVHTFLARGPYNLIADWSYGQGTRNADSVHFTGKSIIDPEIGGYPIVDENGNDGVLTITTTPIRHRPCGRGGCDFDGNVSTTATLIYLGQTEQFTCQ